MVNHYDNSNLRRSLTHFALGKGLGAIIGVFWLLLLVRALTASDYGIYVGFVAYLELFNLLSNLGLTPISERFVPEHRLRNDEPRLRALILKLVSLRILVVFVFATVMAMLAHWTAPLLGFSVSSHAFALFHIVVAVESITRYIETIFDSLLLQGRAQISLFSRTGIRLTLLLLALEYGGSLNLEHWVTLETIAYLCGFVITLCLLWYTLTRLKYERHISINLLPLLAFAAPIFGSQIIGSLIGVDVVKLLALKTAGAEASAIFGFCASLAWMLQRYLPSFLLVGMVRPLIIASANDPVGGARLQRIVSVILKLNAMLIGYALSVSLTLGDQLISVLSGGKFSSGGVYLSLFLLFTLSQTLRATYGHVALARGKGHAMLMGQLAGTVVLTLGVLGSLKFGLYAYSAALVSIDLVWFKLVHRSLVASGQAPFIPWSSLAKILFLTISGWVVGTLFGYFIPVTWAVWKHVAVVSIVAGFIFAGVGAVIRPFTREERDSVNRMLPRSFFVW